MLKLARNTLSSLASLFSSRGESKWQYIAKLIELLQAEGFSLGNKVTSRYLQWQHVKMKVLLATQILSSSVADAISFLRDLMKNPDFVNSKATCEFTFMIDRLFDFTNSQNPFLKGYKATLSRHNEAQWNRILLETAQYLAELRCSGKLSLLM
jgi:hypothetical protein